MHIGEHEEQITFDIAPIGTHSIILGLPWLQFHNLMINWEQAQVQFNLDYCNGHCLPWPHDVFAKQGSFGLQEPEIACIALTSGVALPVKWLSSTAHIPVMSTPGAAGLDLTADHSLTIAPGKRKLVPTGISIALPTDTYGCIAPRSGLALRHSIDISEGVIDSDYLGELKALLINNSLVEYQVTQGEHIAQLIVERYQPTTPVEVDTLMETLHGSQGFGSTGMMAEIAEIYAIDMMPTATTETLKSMVPKEYHDFLDVFDPETPMSRLPPSQPEYDFAIKLDPMKPLPKPTPPYHLNAEEQKDWATWWDTMLKAGLIRKAPPNVPTAAPFFFVWKKDGTHRPVIDYWKLNDITVKDSFPLLRIDEMLEQMQDSKIFLKFNLKMGYNQLCIQPGDEWKTAFMTPDGPFVMNVMTFGFTNAPPHFQRWMSEVLALDAHQNVENYLDNTGTHHETMEEHVSVNQAILGCFRQAGLFANAKKCEFHQEQMGFLGVDVSPKGFEMELVKVETVCNWKPPKTVRVVWEFVGICNFYQWFIKSFSEIAHPLHDLTKQGQKWQWTPNKQHTFETLKEMICQSPVLIHADPTKKFQMETDTSNYVYGAVLSQKSEDQQFHPVAFYSKSMNPAKCNYGILDKEALPIIKGLQYWHHWLERTKEPVRIITDHRNLEYFKALCFLNRRQLRWLEQLKHYNYEIAYQPGDKNSAADALSCKEELHPEVPDEEKPTALFDLEWFIEIALVAFLEDQPQALWTNEMCRTLMDGELID